MSSRARHRSPFRVLASGPMHEISLVGSPMGSPAPSAPRCVHCLRTPLVGEQVHVYAGTGGERTVCTLCRSRHRQPPTRIEIVHSSEHHRAVKARTRAA
jgi:hypothetical protein